MPTKKSLNNQPKLPVEIRPRARAPRCAVWDAHRSKIRRDTQLRHGEDMVLQDEEPSDEID